MGTAGKILFDLNELPDDDLIASSELHTLQSQDQCSSFCSDPHISIRVESSSGIPIQLSESKLPSLPQISSPVLSTTSQCVDCESIAPGQRPLSCFRPFSSFQPIIRKKYVDNETSSGARNKLDNEESYNAVNEKLSSFNEASGTDTIGESIPSEKLVKEELNISDMLDSKTCENNELQAEGNKSLEVVKSQFTEHQVCENKSKDKSVTDIQRPAGTLNVKASLDGIYEKTSGSNDFNTGRGGNNSMDVMEDVESTSPDATLRDNVRDVSNTMEMIEKGRREIVPLQSVSTKTSRKETVIGINVTSKDGNNISTSFNMRFRPDQREAHGKKRSRQTMFLDVNEAVRQAAPFKSSTSRKSLSSLPSHHPKDNSQVSVSSLGLNERADESPLKKNLSLKDQKQSVKTSDVESAAANVVEARKSNVSGPSDGSTQIQMTYEKSLVNHEDTAVLVNRHSLKSVKLDDKQKQSQSRNKLPVVQDKQRIDERQAYLSHRPPLKKILNSRKLTVSGSIHQAHDNSIERLHREATCEKLWRSPGVSELQRVPGKFDSVEEYVQVFEPLLFEECRAQLHSTWVELCDAISKDVHIPVLLKAIERRERGWHDAVLLPVDPRIKVFFKEGDVAILSSPKPGPANYVRRRPVGICNDEISDAEESSRIAGIVRRYLPVDTREPHGAILYFYTGESNVDVTDDQLLKKPQSKDTTWYLTVLGSLATTQREYVALHALQNLHSQMLKAILQPKPDLFPCYEEEIPAMPNCFTQQFVQYLYRTFNRPQLSAIQWAAMHTAAGTGNSSEGGKRHDIWPFTLVQGPPGTGKTHTVWGMLNVIHLVQYQRYYASLLKKLAPESLKSTDESGSHPNVLFDDVINSIDEVLQKMDQSLARVLPKLCPKPRMLVCAPSNAATDEMLTRVLERGFIDGEMRIYRPDVARVGVDSQSRAAQAVSVERRSEQLLAMGRADVLGWLQQLRSRENSLATQIACLKKELVASAVAARSQGAISIDPEVLVARDQSRDLRLQQLASVVEERDKVLVEMSRLFIVEGRLRIGSGISLEEARGKLEASFANEAEIVFTTLSSSGRRIFKTLTHGFDMVVIDEAAQASEVALLPPLGLGAARCVLVGDPQQLPATVISRDADTLQYSRSLFERFQQAICPTILLSVQYRMHPQIRDFPSRYFYQSRLVDSDNIKDLPDEVYHRDPMLGPYLFFDISYGRESHKGGSVSYQNILEARFAVRLYEHLQNALKSAGITKVSVGIITPYKLQLKCLQQEFESLLGSDVESKGVYINTVDAFQGQERDIIMMSCVRASSHGVGFVADIRRMNVALTRARRCLWVMGNATALIQSEDWDALICDAKERGCFVTMADSAANGINVCNLNTFLSPSECRTQSLDRAPRHLSITKGGMFDPYVDANTSQVNDKINLLNNAKSSAELLGRVPDSVKDELWQSERTRWHKRNNGEHMSPGFCQGSVYSSHPSGDAGKVVEKDNKS